MMIDWFGTFAGKITALVALVLLLAGGYEAFRTFQANAQTAVEKAEKAKKKARMTQKQYREHLGESSQWRERYQMQQEMTQQQIEGLADALEAERELRRRNDGQ